MAHKIYTLLWSSETSERYGKGRLVGRHGVRIEPRAAADGTQSDDAESEPNEEEAGLQRTEVRQGGKTAHESGDGSRQGGGQNRGRAGGDGGSRGGAGGVEEEEMAGRQGGQEGDSEGGDARRHG